MLFNPGLSVEEILSAPYEFDWNALAFEYREDEDSEEAFEAAKSDHWDKWIVLNADQKEYVAFMFGQGWLDSQPE